MDNRPPRKCAYENCNIIILVKYGTGGANRKYCSLACLDAARTIQRRNNKAITKEQNAKRVIEKKTIALTQYGPEKQIKCSWSDCMVTDLDMLSLDHIDNSGARDRKIRGTGISLYMSLMKDGWPPGFQTLCHNHQWKKEILRRRTQGREQKL